MNHRVGLAKLAMFLVLPTALTQAGESDILTDPWEYGVRLPESGHLAEEPLVWQNGQPIPSVSSTPGPSADDTAGQNVEEPATAADSPQQDTHVHRCENCGKPKKDEKEACCDKKKQEELAKAVATAYKGGPGPYTGPFYANNFSYLSDPCYCDWHLGEMIKQIPLGCHGMVDFGGEYRLRYQNENNMRGLGLTGISDEFLLQRLRLYSNVKVSKRVRLYGEIIDARSNYEDFNPRPIEEDYFDALNLFADVVLADGDLGKFTARVGRQELLYGAQRQISPLDWANTRRTFEGIRMMWQGSNWDVDGFWVNPVPPIDLANWDEPNYDEKLYGSYATYKKAKEGRKLELYYIGYENDLTDADFHTLGFFFSGNKDNWLLETENAYQFGDFAGNSHSAGAMTLGVGRRLTRCKRSPTVWAYYDWASGSDVVGNGYFHHFPLAHKYLGFMDFYGRRNIKDLNFLFTLPVSKKIEFLAWYHIFQLQDNDDIPYSVVMTPSPPGIAPAAGQSDNLGTEIDFTVSYNMTPHTNLYVGYSHFETGKFYRTNPTAPFAGDADFFYTQWLVRF